MDVLLCLKGIDWKKMEAKEISPPFRPKLAHELDVNNFAEEFTKQAPLYSPAETPESAASKTLFRVSFLKLSFIHTAVYQKLETPQ